MTTPTTARGTVYDTDATTIIPMLGLFGDDEPIRLTFRVPFLGIRLRRPRTRTLVLTGIGIMVVIGVVVGTSWLVSAAHHLLATLRPSA